MKTMFTFLLITISIGVFGQTRSLNDFYHKYKQESEVHGVKIGSFLIKMGAWFVEEPSARSLVRKSKRARILFSEHSDRINNQDIDYLIEDVQSEGYEYLATIRDDGNDVRIYAREDRDYIRNILVLVHTYDEFVMVSLDCKMQYDDISAVINEEHIF